MENEDGFCVAFVFVFVFCFGVVVLIFANGHCVLNDFLECDSYFGVGVAFELIGFDDTLDSELDHLERASDGAANDLRVAQVVQFAVLRQLDEVNQRIRVEYERELVVRCVPVDHCRLNAEEHFERLLGEHLGRLPEVAAAADLRRARQEVFDHAHAHVVADLLELFVHLGHVLQVLDQLRHERPIGQSEQLVGNLARLVHAKLAQLFAHCCLRSGFECLFFLI